MARIRTIKPDFFKNEDVAELDPMARLLFIGLWTQCDREGKMEDRPRRIKAELFPYEEYDVDKGLNALFKIGLIVRYSTDNQDKYLKVLKFSKHQQPNIKEAKSVIPEPENIQEPYEHCADMVQASQERKGKERKGKETVQAQDETIFFPFADDEFLKAWEDWKKYKKSEHNFSYKNYSTEQIALNELEKISKKNTEVAREILTQSIANGWKGFFELKGKKIIKEENNGNIFDTAKSTAERVWERKYGTPFGQE